MQEPDALHVSKTESEASTRPRGTWRVGDRRPVDGTTARAAWTRAARPVLLNVARRYGDYITYKDLAEQVQHDAGIRTTQRMNYWIGKVLGNVARDCRARGEPLLSAFCVHSDETVGSGYAGAVAEITGVVPEDADLHAAEERLKAHRFHGADMPADGGHPRLPPKIACRRSRQKKLAGRRTRPICPNCFIEVNADGICDLCS